jgi:hypothetical protein
MKIKTSTVVSVFGCKLIGAAQGWMATGVMTASFAGNVQFSSPKKVAGRYNLRVINSTYNH